MKIFGKVSPIAPKKSFPKKGKPGLFAKTNIRKSGWATITESEGWIPECAATQSNSRHQNSSKNGTKLLIQILTNRIFYKEKLIQFVLIYRRGYIYVLLREDSMTKILCTTYRRRSYGRRRGASLPTQPVFSVYRWRWSEPCPPHPPPGCDLVLQPLPTKYGPIIIIYHFILAWTEEYFSSWYLISDIFQEWCNRYYFTVLGSPVNTCKIFLESVLNFFCRGFLNRIL